MTFTSPAFLLFLPLTLLIYYIAPKKLQNAVLLAANLLFYWFALPAGSFLGKNVMPLCLFAASAIFTYCIARRIAQNPSNKKALLAISILALLLVLAAFKYGNYLLPVLAGPDFLFKLAFPLGISYYTFMSVSYLVDVYRGDIPAEGSFVRFFVFVSFFGSITMGPICRASAILPALHTERHFSPQTAADAARILLIGAFKQVAVANVLGLSVDYIFQNSASYRGLTLIFAALFYSAQLYYQFSGYSDIAVGVGMLFGLTLPQNFKTPYFATNFSGFWARWHISLSSWLQDYVFMPLVWGKWTSHIPVLGKRVQKPPMISSVAIVFLVSGLWHGNALAFFVWGCLMAAYRVGEELLHKYYKKPQKKPSLPLRIFKSASVYVLWSAGLVFFWFGSAENGLAKALAMFRDMGTGLFAANPAADFAAAIQNGFYPKPVMVAFYVAFMAVVLAAAVLMDWWQCFKLRDRHISTALANLPVLPRWLCYYALLGVILLAFLMQSGGYGGNIQSPYAGF
ncbi:MAG: MBOAT family protein [Oscillospiraceae bacterium]|nr:MBOAT family protein [Oscillospiraceae bacterium]